MAIFLSHGGTSVYESKGLSNEVLVGTVAGIFRIQKNGSSRWSVRNGTSKDCTFIPWYSSLQAAYSLRALTKARCM